MIQKDTFVNRPSYESSPQGIPTRWFEMGEEKIGNFFFAHLKPACETGASCSQKMGDGSYEWLAIILSFVGENGSIR
jgi:hypothetical protein